MPPVLAGGEVGQIPVLRGRPDGRVQHAPVHPEGVQSDGRQGKPRLPARGSNKNPRLPDGRSGCAAVYRNANFYFPPS